MRLHVLSDLHCEFAAFLPDAAAAACADVVILAGDIGLGVAGIEWAARAFDGKPVVYVCGNHEFYGQHWDSTLMEMRVAAERSGVHFLEDDAVVIDGVRFLGTALWTDFCLYGRQRQDASMHLFRNGLNDCRKISAATPLSPEAQLTPAMVLKRHERSRAWLREQLARKFDGKTVVVTHHAPSSRSVAPRYQGDPLTPGFATELPQQMFEEVALWVHGHMHDSCAYGVAVEGHASSCRVVCNPRGYPMDRRGSQFENPQFDPALLIEV
jgi:Icc-related predicted phosphoesterase